MRISLISPYNHINANGLRVISACLKERRHEVSVLFLSSHETKFSEPYSKKVNQNVIELCKHSDLIGFSLMTNDFLKSRNLTIDLKKHLKIPIIWGGIHPTVKPLECLQYADMVCIGEGENAIIELAEKLGTMEIYNIKNIWVRNNDGIRKNEVRHLEGNLDQFPFQDYDIETHYILQQNKILKITDKLLEKNMQKSSDTGKELPQYGIITTRNCPYNCNYCCNNALRKIYNGKGKFVRQRSPQNIIDELVNIKIRFPFIKQILFTDDTFFIRSKENIEEFCSLYKKNVGLPFRCYISPLTADEDKLKMMIEAGLIRVSMGVQSFCSSTLNNLFGRNTKKDLILNKVKMIDKYKSKLPNPLYHIIVDNPYETIESKRQNLDFIASLPNGARAGLFPLVFYPGTSLYQKAKKDKIIKNEMEEVYFKSWSENDVLNMDYLTFLMYRTIHFKNSGFNIPLKRILQFLYRDKIVAIFDNKLFLFFLIQIRNIAGTSIAIRLRKWFGGKFSHSL